MKRKCPRCGNRFVPKGRGRPPRFCSARCRLASWRDEKGKGGRHIVAALFVESGGPYGHADKVEAAAAVECAAGHWARAFSTAAVPEGVPVGPRILAEIGRDLAKHSRSVYLLNMPPGGRLRLLRASLADVWGDGPDPADWWYRLTLAGPRTTRIVVAPADNVLHVRYATEAHSPQRGVAPLTFASLTGTLIANLETSVGQEAGGAVAKLIAMPAGHNAPADLRDSIKTAKGRTLLPETVADGWGDADGAPGRDFQPARLGPDPPAALVALRAAVENSVLSAFGIPVPLGPSGTH